MASLLRSLALLPSRHSYSLLHRLLTSWLQALQVSGKIGDLKRKEQPAQIDAPLPGDASADATVEVPVPQSAAEADAEAPMAEDAAVASAPEGEGMDDDAGGAQEAGSEVAGASVDANGGIAPADEQVSGMDE